MTTSVHPAAPHHLPAFLTTPGETDVLMVMVAVFLVVAVLMVGILFLRLHTLPERLAHKGHKLQFEIVAVLGLLALFTHVHLFWVAGLLLALIDIPDFSGSLNRIAGSAEAIAGLKPGEGAVIDRRDAVIVATKPGDGVAAVADGADSAPDGAMQASDKITRRPDARTERTHA
jgi:hypothetical protein